MILDVKNVTFISKENLKSTTTSMEEISYFPMVLTCLHTKSSEFVPSLFHLKLQWKLLHGA